ncbi:MAG: nucleotidyltransferase domain-containing protein, partial [Chitinophagaceae bacterium]
MSLRTDILATLTYFDLFHYPLTALELRLFSRRPHQQAAISAALRELLAAKQVFCFDGLYTLHNDASLAPRRRRGNAKARELLYTAGKVAQLVSCFPFVRGVAVSGSLSKNWADERSDIDLFLITAPNRLWLARTLLHGLKKLSYLVGRQHLFCMNYYVDEEGLQIKEKNIYTATELATLLPLRGIHAFQQLYKSN